MAEPELYGNVAPGTAWTNKKRCLGNCTRFLGEKTGSRPEADEKKEFSVEP
jgi:hypothetical protein